MAKYPQDNNQFPRPPIVYKPLHLQTPQNSQFPIHPILTLPVFPHGSNLHFRVPSSLHLTNEDHIILDNLWINRNPSYFKNILNIAASYLSDKNSQAFAASTSHLSLSPQPSSLSVTKNPSLEAYLRLENEKKEKEAEIVWLKRELEREKEKNKKVEILEKEYLYESMKNWEDHRSTFPPQLSEVKGHILEMWSKNKLEEQKAVQAAFRFLAKNQEYMPSGLALSMLVYQQSEHPNEHHCFCKDGFYIYKCSLGLSRFQSVNLQNRLHRLM